MTQGASVTSMAEQIRVQFETPHARFRVTDAPIAVPARLKHEGLSSVICHLLALEPAMPFDFIIDGVLLRGSLRRHMKQHGLSEVRPWRRRAPSVLARRAVCVPAVPLAR